MNAQPFHLSKRLHISSAPLFQRRGLKSIRQPSVSLSPSAQPCSVIRVSNGPPVHLSGWAVPLPHNSSHSITSETTQSRDRDFQQGYAPGAAAACLPSSLC